MSEVRCGVEWCDRPVADAYTCSSCARGYERDLGNVHATVGELETTLAKRRTNFPNGNGGPGRETPLPFHDPASEVLWALGNELSTQVRMVSEERGAEPSGDTLPAMAGWMLHHVEWVRHQRFGHEFVEGMRFIMREACRIVDRPPERVYAGPCADCGGDLYAKPDAAMAECRPCGVEFSVDEMREWMKSQVYGRLVTAREGAALLSRFDLETKQGTIDTWFQRKRLVSKGHDPEGRRLYLFDDLVTLAARAQRPDTPSERVAV